MPSLAVQLHSHLVRLMIWSILSLLVGAFGLATVKDSGPRSFFTMSAGWAAVNLVIVGASWMGKPPAVLAPFREFLWLNIGLNIAYISVGVTMAILAGTRDGIKGAGIAVGIQGLALLILDGWLLASVPSGH